MIEYKPSLKMYETVIERTLCAWVENPSTSQAINKPKTLHVEIIDADGATREAVVKEIGKCNHFTCSFNDLHRVHVLNQWGYVVEFLGEPPK